MFVCVRVLIGCLFIFSGYQKLLQPYTNFFYVLQGYEILPQPLDKMLAIGLPWLEYLIGIFMVLGLRLKASLKTLWFFFIIFILSIGQAIIRNLPLEECGCFGEGFSLPLPGMLLVDSLLLILVTFLRAKIQKTSQLSLDQHYLKKSHR